MSDLLSGYSTEIRGAMKDVWDSFKRQTQLTFFKPAVETIVAFDPDYNGDLSEFSNPDITKTTESSSFSCRIWYPKRENTLTTFVEGGSNLQVDAKQQLGIIRIQMEEDAFTYIQGVERFVFGTETYRMLTDVRKIAILGEFQFYDVYLQKVN